MREYLAPIKKTENVIVIERSRFITTVLPIAEEAEAQTLLNELRKKYYDATHNCYAYIVDPEQSLARFSDDGEPSGTAGQPMLEVLKKRGVCKALVVVTRYFGGIKLGAGGLVSAYTRSVSEALDKANIGRFMLCTRFSAIFDYSLIGAFKQAAQIANATVTDYSYDEKVTANLYVVSDKDDEFQLFLVDKLNGAILINKLKEEFLLINSK